MLPSAAPRIFAIAGSLRAGSLNRRLLRHAIGKAEGLGAEVDEVEARDWHLPLYDGDLEAASGLPAAVVALKARLSTAEGMLIACPEYNNSFPGPFKNAIDWMTRPPGNVFTGKVVALMGASTGAAGAMRAVAHLRQVLTSRGSWVIPAQVTVSRAEQSFDEDGILTDSRMVKSTTVMLSQFIEQISRMRG